MRTAEQPLLSSDNDLLGQTLLRIGARGMTVLSEVHRIGALVPAQATGDAPFLPRLADYFADPDVVENRIAKSCAQHDEAFMRSNLQYLERFYLMLNRGLVGLARSTVRLLRDLRKGFFIGWTLERVLLDADGKQLLPEVLHNLATATLLLDRLVPGPVRERLLVALYRCKGETQLPGFDQVIELAKDAESSLALLARLGVDPRACKTVASRIQAEDVYGHTRAWPSPEHRGTALANQAALLFSTLLLAECPSSHAVSGPLSANRAEMREICDKHFNEQWVVSLCPGFIVDLELEWAPFPAARGALSESIANASALRQDNHQHLVATLAQVASLQAALSQRFVTDNWGAILDALRAANAAFRWRALHGKSRSFATRPRTKADEPSTGLLAGLLLRTAKLEDSFKRTVRLVLSKKDEIWNSSKKRVADRMNELALYYSGEVPLARVAKDEELQRWFSTLAAEIASLSYEHAPTAVGRRVQTLISALEEAEKLDSVDGSLQIREFLADSRAQLERMVQAVGVREELLATVDVVSDLSWAWGDVLADLEPAICAFVVGEPKTVSLLEPLMGKLAAVLDYFIARPAQAGSADVDSLADLWSQKLAACATRVLGSVPRAVCALLDDVGDALGKVPRLDARVGVQAMAAPAARYELARSVYNVSLLSEGMLGMGEIRFGLVGVQPRGVLEDEVDAELGRRVAQLLSTPPDASALENDLARRAVELDKLRAAMQLVSDLLGGGERPWAAHIKAATEGGGAPGLLRLLAGEAVVPAVAWAVLGQGGFETLAGLLRVEVARAADEAGKLLASCEALQGATGELGSAAWVDEMRRARNKAGKEALDKDLAAVHRVGALERNRRAVAAKASLKQPHPRAHGSSALRLVLLLNELSKRRAAGEGGVDVTALAHGFAVLACDPAVDSLVRLDAQALLSRAFEERRQAEASLFAFGAGKVSKIALQRMHKYVEFWRLVVHLRGVRVEDAFGLLSVGGALNVDE